MLYFDNINLIKNDPVKFGLLKKELSLVIEAINVERDNLIQQCVRKKQNGFVVYNAVKSLMEESFYDNISQPSECTKAKVEALKKLLDPDSEIGKDRFKIFPKIEVVAIFENMVRINDQAFTKSIDYFLQDSNPDAANYGQLIYSLGDKLNNVLLNLIPDEKVKLSCADIPKGRSAFLKGKIVEHSYSFLNQIKASEDNPCKDIIETDSFNYVRGAKDNSKSCVAPIDIETILGAMKPLMQMGTEINEKILPILLNPESTYADQIVKAIMPGCLDQERLISLGNVGCDSFPLCDPTHDFNDSNTYTGPKSGCHSMDFSKKMIRTKSLKGINQGRALGVLVCTAFLTNPEVKTNFCTGGLPSGEKHGFHELTITGYRCKADQIEYEIVNSWGSRCEDNRNIECQKDKYGNTTGPFWVKEESLVDSSKNISTIIMKSK